MLELYFQILNPLHVGLYLWKLLGTSLLQFGYFPLQTLCVVIGEPSRLWQIHNFGASWMWLSFEVALDVLDRGASVFYYVTISNVRTWWFHNSVLNSTRWCLTSHLLYFVNKNYYPSKDILIALPEWKINNMSKKKDICVKLWIVHFYDIEDIIDFHFNRIIFTNP